MDLVVAWLLFPLALLVLCAGCGLLADRAAGGRTPGPLVPLVGFAAVVVVAQFPLLADQTAEWAAPAVALLAVAGLVAGRRRLGPGLEPLALAAAAGVFCVYAAPIVLAGEPTIAGFIRLDDTATWLALTDRLAEHGRDLDGLAPSTYEATLAFNLGDGYPVGAFAPLAVAARLSPSDPAWLIQPYAAFVAALLALGLWSLATPLRQAPVLRAVAAFVAAQSALLFGYYLWGGIKEVIAAALIAGTAALAARAAQGPGARAALVAPVLTAAALVGVLSAGALIWLAPPLLGAAAVLAHRAGLATALRRSLLAAGAIALLCAPVAISGSLLPPTSAPLTDGDARGNLVGPLDPLQAAGIWPAGDFRLDPALEPLASVLIAVAVAGAIAGVAWSARRRALGPLLYVPGALIGCAILVIAGSPWVGGKALATASPAIPFAAMLGAGWLAARGWRAAAVAGTAVVASGVVWSNAAGYGGASLAPRPQLAELERIGEWVAGSGPTLITEYSPYGARHFLRDSDPEAISELRRHSIPLRDGSEVPKGGYADTDEIDPLALGFYRTLVVRRSPSQSRPPASYRLVWSGEYYEAWQRPAGASVLAARLPLGGVVDPFGRPVCDRVLELAERGDLLAAGGEPPLVIGLERARYPRSWATPGTRGTPVPAEPGTLVADVDVGRAGEYEVWLRGSLGPGATVEIDGRQVGAVRHRISNRGGYIGFGSVELAPGAHTLELIVGGPDAHPGSAEDAGPIGPLVLSATEAADVDLTMVPAAEARNLCGRRWDWIEVAS